MGSSHGFASCDGDGGCPLQARVHSGSGWNCLNRTTTTHSPDHTPKGTLSGGLATSPSNGLEAHDFRFSFTPLTGVLFTVPSRYSSLSVMTSTLPWGVVPPASDRVLRARPYSGTEPPPRNKTYTAITCSGWAFQTHSALSHLRGGSEQAPRFGPTTPATQRLSLDTLLVWASTHFVRHYSGCRSTFLRLLRCFSWPGSLHQLVVSSQGGGVAPFGDLRVTACKRLT
jgi:hypothetical protein